MRIESVFAHCDIPCKIYDPVSAQIAGLTVVRLLSLMANLSANEKTSLENQHEMSRLTAQKEEHASLVKSEIATIWGDYFKKNHLVEIYTPCEPPLIKSCTLLIEIYFLLVWIIKYGPFFKLNI